MKLWSQLLLALLLSWLASSEAGAEVLVSAGTGLVYEKSNNGREYEVRQPYGLRGGYRFSLADAYLEFSSFSAYDGSAYVQLRRTHYEWMAWVRHVFFEGWRVQPYGAVAGGIHYDQLQTTLGTETLADNGLAETLLAAALGFQVSPALGLMVDIESKVEAAGGLDFSPLLSFAIYLGWRF